MLLITEADNGRTFHVGIGQRATLRLTNAERWTPPAVSWASVRLVAVNYLINPGFSEWSVVPVVAGTSAITSTGEPNCPAGSPCPSAKTAFRVEIDVS